MSAVQTLIAEAIKTLGWSDENNTVRTPVHTWYNAKFGNPDPGKYAWDWCDGWVTYIAWQSGNQKAVAFGDGYAYTVDHAKAFKSRGQWHTDTAGIAAGDIVFFDWDGSNDIEEIDHVGIVEYVSGPEIHTIEGNIENAVRRKVRTSATIVGYGRPAYADSTTTPPPTNGGGSVTTIYFEDTGSRGTVAANKVVQTALNKWHPASALLVDGIFGPVTSGRYKLWQESLYGKGPDSDGIPGVSSLTSLGKRSAYPFTVKRKASAPSTPPPSNGGGSVSLANYLTAPEPAHDYSRVTYGGKTVNVRTRTMLQRAADWAGVSIRLTQGSYNRGVAASAGTHDGGGCVDLNVDAWSSATRSKVVQCLRKAGFAAWLRTPAEGFVYHIHACAIGDREMASVARNQVQSYFNGRNGLASNGRTDGATHWPNWADKYNQ